MAEGYYGSKCHICGCLSGTTHNAERIPWLSKRGLECETCEFCQERALTRLLETLTLEDFHPEVRAAVIAFRKGEEHPVLDALRAELQAEVVPEQVEFRGYRWTVADSRWDESGLAVGSHWHLTLTNPQQVESS